MYIMEGIWVTMEVKGMVGVEVVRDRVRRIRKGGSHVLQTMGCMLGVQLSVIMIKFWDLLNVFSQ